MRAPCQPGRGAGSELSFANPVIGGDVTGVETLFFGQYRFTATAIFRLHRRPWPNSCVAPGGDSLLRTLAELEGCSAEMVKLRCGQGAERVRRPLTMLARTSHQRADGGSVGLPVSLPPLQDMADITALALTMETVSRRLRDLRQAGILVPLRRDGRPAKRIFAIQYAAATSWGYPG